MDFHFFVSSTPRLFHSRFFDSSAPALFDSSIPFHSSIYCVNLRFPILKTLSHTGFNAAAVLPIPLEALLEQEGVAHSETRPYLSCYTHQERPRDRPYDVVATGCFVQARRQSGANSCPLCCGEDETEDTSLCIWRLAPLFVLGEAQPKPYQPYTKSLMHPNTRLALAGQNTDSCYNSIVPPLYQSAIFRFEDIGQTKGFDYTRSGNPTRKALEDVLADLDGGAGAVALTSGMAAISTTLALFDAGAHLICSHDCYGGTERLLCHLQDQGKLEVSFVDLTDLSALHAAIRPNTQAVWVETPSNPLLRIVDVQALADVTQAYDLTLVVDNTFLSPILQQPLALGADLVVYSTTKYINGHSDVVGGAIIAKTPELNERVQFTANAFGTIAQPFDCWLVLRGIKTLPLRMKQHEANAQAVAEFLDAHPNVERVFYPGLPEHAGHELAKKQQYGFGGMVSFEVRGGTEAINLLLRSTQVFSLAESLGGVESLIEQPATMSHASMRPEQRAEAGITDNVIRLSVGIEDINDLLTDLDQALRGAPAVTPARVEAIAA